MIKSIVEKIMIKQFSKYINGIEYNKLTIEVLGGFFSIENISLNHQFFNTLQTPFLVAFSHIGKLSIEAPLTKLSSVPVSVTIEDVFVIVQLKKQITHLNEVSKQELLKKYIKDTFDLLVSKMKDADKQEGRLDKLGKKIVDNLKFNIKNIHIRFQEKNQLHCYSFGASLKELTFGTTDRQWKPVFVERQKSKAEEPIYKLMNIQKFKIYWQSLRKDQKEYQFLTMQSPKVKIEAMRKYVLIEEDSLVSINCGVKLTVDPALNHKLPLIDISIDLQPININFSKQKIVQVLDFTTSCIKHNEIMLKTLLQKANKKSNPQQEKQLKPLCTKYVENLLAKEMTQKKGKKQHQKDKEEGQFCALFSEVSIENLYEWAMEPIKNGVQTVRQKEIRKQKTGWFSSTEYRLSPQEKKQLERVMDQLAQDSITGKGRPADCLLLQLSLRLKGLYFHFYDQNTQNKLKTIELRIESIGCNLQKSHDNSWLSVNSKIGRIVADLRIEEKGVVKDIHLMENLSDEREYLLESMYHQTVKVGAKSTQMTYFTDITLGKTIFTYKKQYMKMFSSFFSLPEIDQQVQNQAFGKFQLFRAESSEDQDNPIVIEKKYNINLSLSSPSFVLPLTDSSCWYLDLGTIQMKSKYTPSTFIYPFKLRSLNMRYIHSKNSLQTSQLIAKQKQFFPIINNIDIDVNMTTCPQENTTTFDVLLQKVELSATRQEFVNLLNVKKFLIGEEQDQLLMLQQQKKSKEELVSKAKLKSQLLKRGKYLHNWVQYCCLFVNNSIYLYPSESQLIPDSIISLRGAKITPNISTHDSTNYQLEISTQSDTNYLRFADKNVMEKWQEELNKAVLELKNKDELLLGQELHKKKKHHGKKEETMAVNLTLGELSWNYLNSKGQSFMKIELENIKFKMNELEDRLSTTLIISQLNIYDRVYQYHNPKYQHFLKSQNLSITIQKVKQKLTKISPVIINTQLEALDLNWKPDAILMLIQSIKQFMDIRPLSRNKDKSRGQIIKEISEDGRFKEKREKYSKNGSGYAIKEKREEYLRLNSKDDEVYVKMGMTIDNLSINFIHRQSHMPMFQLQCHQLHTDLNLAKSQKYIEGHLNTLNLFEIFGYPQKRYDVNTDYPPYCLVQKKASCNKEQHALNFRYSQYQPDQIPNKQKVDNFLSLVFAPLTIHYYQEVTFRLIDYGLIQIIMLLTNPDMITANEAVLQQLMKDSSKKSLQNYKYFIEEQFENVVKRFFDPYFMDYHIVLEKPEIVLSPTKDHPHYFLAHAQQISVNNVQLQQNRRFAKTDYTYKDLVYQEDVVIKIVSIELESVNGKYRTQMVRDPFSCAMVVNRLLFEEDIVGITPELVGYDRTISITNQITPVCIPQLSKVLYENLMRLPNFNLTFLDGQEQLFIHNYKITKTLSPKPIQYSMTIADLLITAQHSIDQNVDLKLKLFDINIHNFGLSYRRDERLNANVEVNIEQARSNYFQYGDSFYEAPQVKTLARIDRAKQKDHCYFLIKLNNNGKIDIQGLIEECELFMNLAVMPLIADWVQVDQSVFADHPKFMRPIYCVIRMPKLMVLVENHNNYDSNLKMEGEVVIEVNRNKCESENYLKQAYATKTINHDYIEKLREFMSIKLSLGVEFFNRVRGRDRKLLDKVGIEIQELDFFKIRKDRLSRTMTRRMLMTNMQGSISIDDVMLFKSIGDTVTWGGLHERHFKQYLQAQLGKAELVESSLYKDVFKEVKILEEMVFRIQSIKFYFISKENAEYLPILRFFADQASVNLFVNAGSTVITGDFKFQVKYFNDQIFRWQPLIEPVQLRWNILNNQHQQQAMELDVVNDIYINFSSQNAVSIKKFIKVIEDTTSHMEKGEYKPDVAQEFLSRYVIKNESGYPLQIFDEHNVSVFIIMPGERVNYTSKAIMMSFFEQNQLSETIAFSILHPKYQLLPVSGISLENQKSFDIELYTVKGVRMPQKFNLRLKNEIKGCKKIITIHSKKYITDYSSNVAVTQYFPFDHEDQISLTDLHKEFKANFYKNLQSQRFLYLGYEGHLTIRKKYLVYNYTMIPLEILECTCLPGTFVGINGPLKIQGVPYQDSPLKVVFNQQKKEYYIYSICYMIDYAGLNIDFDTDHQILQLYSHNFKEKNRKFTIYLLPTINTNFAVMMGRSSKKKQLQGKLAKEVFNLANGRSLYSFSCFSRLQTFCEQNIKDFRKVIEITSAYTFCNDTDYEITYKQVGTKEKANVLKPHQNRVFYWQEHCLPEMVEISIISQKQEWKVSSPLPIKEVTETFVVRSKTNQADFKILSLELEETNNITFVHIVDASQKIEILNSIPHSTLSIYQQVIFENKNVDLKQPENYICQVPYKIRRNFGYELPRHNHAVTVQIDLDQEHYNWRCPSFSLPDIENNLIEKEIEVKSKEGVKKLVIALSFDKNTKTIEFSLKKRHIFNKAMESQIKCKLKNIKLSLIGLHEEKRKEIINVCISDIAINFYINEKCIQSSFAAQNIRIENTLKADPYFVSLFRQAQKSNKPAVLFAIKKSRTNTRLLYYIGFSMRRAVLSVTSQELAILEENMNRIMERLDEKSDTNVFLNLEDKFTPKKIISDQKLYFSEAQIHPIKLIVTYKHVNNWGGALLKALSINQCKVTVDGKKLSNFVCTDILEFATKTGAHFKEGFQNEVFSMIGSLALLGSPLNLASKIGGGISNLVTLPAEGFQDEGVLGVGKGLVVGTGSLVSNTIQGAFGTVESITGTIGNGISGLASYDKDFQRKRQELKNERVDHVGQGLFSGGKSIANGFFTGITGLVTEPMKGAEKQGVGGFFKGGLKGLTGLIVKPVSGVIDATSKTAEGIKNTTKVFSKENKQLRLRTYIPRPFYGASRQIRAYDSMLADWNQQLSTHKSRYQNLSWVGLYELKGGQLLIVTYEYLLFVGRGKYLDIQYQINASNMLSVAKDGTKIILSLKLEDNKLGKMTIEVRKVDEFYTQLKRVYQHYHKNYQIGIERRTPV